MFKFLKDTRKLVLCGILSALAFALALIEIPTPFQSYLSIDFSEIPILIGAYSLGPGGLILIAIIRSLLRFFIKGTLIFGEVAAICASIICGLMFILINKANDKKLSWLLYIVFYALDIAIMVVVILYQPSWWIFAVVILALPILLTILVYLIPKWRESENKKLLLSSITSIFVVTIFMTLLNFFFLTPSNFLGKVATYQAVLDMGFSMNDYIYGYILPLLPFNILKYSLVFIVFYLLRSLLNFVKKKES